MIPARSMTMSFSTYELIKHGNKNLIRKLKMISVTLCYILVSLFVVITRHADFQSHVSHCDTERNTNNCEYRYLLLWIAVALSLLHVANLFINYCTTNLSHIAKLLVYLCVFTALVIFSVCLPTSILLTIFQFIPFVAGLWLLFQAIVVIFLGHALHTYLTQRYCDSNVNFPGIANHPHKWRLRLLSAVTLAVNVWLLSCIRSGTIDDHERGVGLSVPVVEIISLCVSVLFAVLSLLPQFNKGLITINLVLAYQALLLMQLRQIANTPQSNSQFLQYRTRVLSYVTFAVVVLYALTVRTDVTALWRTTWKCIRLFVCSAGYCANTSTSPKNSNTSVELSLISVLPSRSSDNGNSRSSSGARSVSTSISSSGDRISPYTGCGDHCEEEQEEEEQEEDCLGSGEERHPAEESATSLLLSNSGARSNNSNNNSPKMSPRPFSETQYNSFGVSSSANCSVSSGGGNALVQSVRVAESSIVGEGDIESSGGSPDPMKSKSAPTSSCTRGGTAQLTTARWLQIFFCDPSVSFNLFILVLICYVPMLLTDWAPVDGSDWKHYDQYAQSVFAIHVCGLVALWAMYALSLMSSYRVYTQHQARSQKSYEARLAINHPVSERKNPWTSGVTDNHIVTIV